MTAPWPPAAGPVFCVGETMTDLAPAPPDSVETGESLRLSVADAESNVAMYLADLGLAAVWLSALGDDPFGRRVRTAVAAAGVDVSGVRSDPSRPTGLVDFLPLVNEGDSPWDPSRGDRRGRLMRRGRRHSREETGQ